MVKHISFALDDDDAETVKDTKSENESWEDWAIRAAECLGDV